MQYAGTDFGSLVSVVMNFKEELPRKTIQKRVKEFSLENRKLAEERKDSKMLRPNTTIKRM